MTTAEYSEVEDECTEFESGSTEVENSTTEEVAVEEIAREEVTTAAEVEVEDEDQDEDSSGGEEFFESEDPEKTGSMKDFVEYLVRNLVDDPSSVDIRCFEGARGIIVEIRVASGDVGKVVGSRGRTIKALRTIVMTVCSRVGRKVRVELIEEDAE